MMKNTKALTDALERLPRELSRALIAAAEAAPTTAAAVEVPVDVKAPIVEEVAIGWDVVVTERDDQGLIKTIRMTKRFEDDRPAVSH